MTFVYKTKIPEKFTKIIIFIKNTAHCLLEKYFKTKIEFVQKGFPAKKRTAKQI